MRSLFKLLLGLASFSTIYIALCETTHETQEKTANEALGNNSDNSKEMCSDLFEKFCKDLNSEEIKQNLTVTSKKSNLVVNNGLTDKGFAHESSEFINAKIKSKDKLPSDLKKHLDEVNYFEKLKEFSNLDIRKLTKRKSIELNSKSSDLAELWNKAIDFTVIDRIAKKHPDYDTSEDQHPLEMLRIQEEMENEITTAIWNDHPNWKKVPEMFSDIQSTYIEYLKGLKNIPESIKQEWIKKISTIKLVLPNSGDLPGCDSTLKNAFYFTNKHEFTVCAGLFNNFEGFAGIIAHELSHSLDPVTEIQNHKLNSELGKKLSSLQNEVCKKAPLDHCPRDWKDIQNKESLGNLLNSLIEWKPSFPDFYQCLMNKENLIEDNLKNNPLNSKQLQDSVDLQSRKINELLADNNLMLLLTKHENIDDNGKSLPNPVFKNPCSKIFKGSTTEVKDIESPQMQMTIFTSAYICADSKLSDADKIRQASSQTLEIQNKIIQTSIPIGGKFSGNELMNSMNYAENIQERFADNLGNAVYAKFLKKSGLSNEDIRKSFFVGSAFFCDKPSLASKYPEEAEAQKKSSIEPHSEGNKRRLELMGEPIREVLGCKKDENVKDCTL